MSEKYNNNDVFDLLVIGMGPAGISCAIQACREGLRVAITGDEAEGGLVAAARRIDNLAGSPGISGRTLASRLKAHLATTKAVVFRHRVTALIREAPLWRDLSGDTGILSKTVCFATGTEPTPQPWDIAESVTVHRDIRTIVPDLEGQSVTVIGGGDAAFDSALSARDRGAAVTVLMRGTRPRAAIHLVDEVISRGIETRTNTEIQGIFENGESPLDILTSSGSVAADHVMACIGRQPRLGIRVGHDPIAESWFVPDLPWPGVFWAGDVIRGSQRFVATAMGDGQRAAIDAARLVAEWDTEDV